MDISRGGVVQRSITSQGVFNVLVVLGIVGVWLHLKGSPGVSLSTDAPYSVGPATPLVHGKPHPASHREEGSLQIALPKTLGHRVTITYESGAGSAAQVVAQNTSRHSATVEKPIPLQAAPKPQRQTPVTNRRGIMIWAPGRCGTTTFTTSMEHWINASVGITPLCDSSLRMTVAPKEPFLQTPPTRQNWKRCLTTATKTGLPYYLHLKPMHLWNAPDGLHKPEAIMEFAQRMGIKVVVTIERMNWLAREVSAAELNLANKLAQINLPVMKQAAFRKSFMAEYFKFSNSSESNEMWVQRTKYREFTDAADLSKGELAARNLGLRVLKFAYTRDNWPCNQVKQAVAAAVEEGVLPRMPDGDCVTRQKISDHASRRSEGLEERVGARAAGMIRTALVGHADAWMLDLSREAPPGSSPGYGSL